VAFELEEAARAGEWNTVETLLTDIGSELENLESVLGADW